LFRGSRTETFQDDANIYLVLEYCHGGDLFGLMGQYDDEKLPVEAAQFYAASIASVFEHIHAKRIIYRDLKTENLLLDRQGYLKVADFGFAKKLGAEEGARTWTLCGTPEHLAPEIIQNKGHHRAADWWTLGINMFEFLAGEPPFNGDTPIGTYRLIVAGNFEFPADFNDAARDLISKFLAADPEKRFGCLEGGAKDVLEHPFFAEMAFAKLVAKQLPPPYVPDVDDDEDISNFEEPEDQDDGIDTTEVTLNQADFEAW
jgi:serine/threonine protein kinase